MNWRRFTYKQTKVSTKSTVSDALMRHTNLLSALLTHRLPFASPASRTAVSVALFNDDRFKCFGPFGVNTRVPFEHVFLNLGNGYNSMNGIFTVLHSGVYSLALTVYSDAGAPDTILAACAGLQVNGQVVAGSRDRNRNDQEDSSSIVVAIHLEAGDEVSVNLPIGCFLCDDNNHYNTFSAFLLYNE